MKKLTQSHLQPQNLQKKSGYGVSWCFNMTCLCGVFKDFGMFIPYMGKDLFNLTNIISNARSNHQLVDLVVFLISYNFSQNKGSWHIFQLQKDGGTVVVM